MVHSPMILIRPTRKGCDMTTQPDPNENKPFIGDGLIRFLMDTPGHGFLKNDLPKEHRNSDILRVCESYGYIEFGWPLSSKRPSNGVGWPGIDPELGLLVKLTRNGECRGSMLKLRIIPTATAVSDSDNGSPSSDQTDITEQEPDDDYKTAAWFAKNTPDIYIDRIQAATDEDRKTKKVRYVGKGRKKRYHWKDVRRNWPEDWPQDWEKGKKKYTQ